MRFPVVWRALSIMVERRTKAEDPVEQKGKEVEGSNGRSRTELERELNPKQLQFVNEYVGGEYMGNATRSYAKVYNTTTDNSAAASAAYLLTVPKVAALIEELRRESAAEVVEELRS